MPKDIFQFACPCCGKQIEVDVRSGRARAVVPKEAKGRGDLDTLLEQHKTEGQRLDSVFDEAQQRHVKERERLEQLFGKAVDDAAKAKDEKPPNPFDLE